MTPLWRLWIVWMTLLSAAVSVVSLQPSLAGTAWPVAGLWAAAAWAAVGLSVWAAGSLVLLGLFIDYVTDAPIGAWPFAFLCAYGVALVAWARVPPLPVIAAECVAVIGGLIAAALSLGIAGDIAGRSGFAPAGFMPDFIATALLYPLARFVYIPASVRREGRR